MSHAVRCSRLLPTALLLLTGGCERLKPKQQLPPFLVLMEQDRGEEPKEAALRAFPLAAKVAGRWNDVSFDPENESGDWQKVTLERFPLKARPTLQALSLGRPIGEVVIDSVGPEEVACNRLVLGHARLKAMKVPAGSLKAPLHFLGALGLPNQEDWTCFIDLKRREEIQKHLEALARASLKVPSNIDLETPAWGWFQGGKPARSFVAGSLVFRLPQDSEGLQHLAVWNAVVEISGTGTLNIVWESSGVGVETEPPLTYEFLDAVDLDGDGLPEILFRATAYESSGFSLLAIGPGPAKVIWTGSEYGC